MTGRILIIDDDVRLADMISAYLGEAGFTVEARHTAAAGLEAARARPGAPGWDAVILDIMLPDMDGLEVCRRLRDLADLGVLMLSARGEEADRIVGLELGADDYLPKPFNPRELLARRAGETVPREDLASALKVPGGYDPSVDRSLDVHVSHLRHKLGDDVRESKLIRTVRGVG